MHFLKSLSSFSFAVRLYIEKRKQGCENGFSSLQFILIFMPIFFTVYYLTPGKYRNAVLLAGSLAFYFVGTINTPVHFVLFVASIVSDFLAGMCMEKRQKYKKAILKIRVHEATGSSNTYYRFYHIDKVNGKIAELKDLFTSDGFAAVLADNLRKQMKKIMAKDSSKIYWIENAKIGQDFVTLDDKLNFYWDKDGNLVIVFDKYEVAPGSMGTPEFVIEKGSISDILKPEYR